MADPTIDEKHIHNRQIYNALLTGKGDRVIELCKQVPKGPLHVLTMHQDTVLHMATFSEQQDMVSNLLRELPEKNTDTSSRSNMMLLVTVKNDWGNTVLHDAATSNKLIPEAREMLRREPELLMKRNRSGETALARAARYGSLEMFKFLDHEVKKALASKDEEERVAFYKRNDKATILHGSVIAEHFDLALYIATRHPYLVNAKDGNGMTALQLLACNPSAFEIGTKHYLKRLINFSVKVPFWEAILGKKQKYESAVSLAEFLIPKDTSWDVPQTSINLTTPKTHKYGELASSNSWVQLVGEVQKTPRSSKIMTPETPLFLATKSGILEIVKEILNKYPQAIEHIDHEGQNILHVAIQYRQIHIFDFVEKIEVPMKNLMRKITDHGNSVLHMIGDKPDDDDFDEDMRSPALVLRENLLLFERVKKISANNFKKHYNNDGKTADKLFAESNAKLRRDAQEWLKRTAENCSIVAVLISTVAFAAAYTVPGGPNQATGYPLLLNQPFFIIFALTDALSLTFALTSVITFLSILTSSFHLKDFKQSLPQKLMLGITLLILSVSMMMLAFAATVILLIRNKEQWTRIVSYSVAFLPVSIFTLTYLPLYIELMKTFTYTLKKISEAFSVVLVRSWVVLVRSWVTKSLKCSRTSNPTDQSLANAGSFTRSSAPQTTHDPV